MQRVASGSARDAFMSLLLFADDSEAYVRSYYQQGDLLVLRDPCATWSGWIKSSKRG